MNSKKYCILLGAPDGLKEFNLLGKKGTAYNKLEYVYELDSELEQLIYGKYLMWRQYKIIEEGIMMYERVAFA